MEDRDRAVLDGARRHGDGRDGAPAEAVDPAGHEQVEVAVSGRREAGLESGQQETEALG